jgi:hypothetical protein
MALTNTLASLAEFLTMINFRILSIVLPPKPTLSDLPGSSMALFVLVVGLMLVLQACDGSGGGTATAPVSFGVSDAPVEGLAAVVITIDRITLNRPGSADVVIDRFTSDELGVFDEDTITVDVLDYRGEDNVLIVGPVDLNVADYQNLRLEIIEDDVTKSYVEELGGDILPIKVPSGELQLGGFEVEDSGDQTFILEFALRKAMTYNPGPDRYILKPRGVRIVEVDRGTTIEGFIDPGLFDDTSPCDVKADPFDGNVVYVYQGTGLDPGDFADDFDPALDPIAADSYLEPFASEMVADDGNYVFGYLPAGDYTLAFSCEAIDDDPEFDDGIVIPSPTNEFFEVSTSPGDRWACDFGVPDDGCASIVP